MYFGNNIKKTSHIEKTIKDFLNRQKATANKSESLKTPVESNQEINKPKPKPDTSLDSVNFGEQTQDETKIDNDAIKDNLDNNFNRQKEEAKPGDVLDVDPMKISSDVYNWNSGLHFTNVDVYKKTGKIEGNEIKNPLFKNAIDYLKSKGTDKFVNEGNVEVGDKVYFFASNDYWDYLRQSNSSKQNQDYLDSNRRPLLLVKEHPKGTTDINGRKYQIIGTFNYKNNDILQEKILKDKLDSSSSEFISTESTTVNYVTAGRLEFNNDKPVSSLLSSSKNLTIGISDNATIHSNGKASRYMPITSTDPNKNRGRIYMMLKAANGLYMPVAMRVKPFKEVDLNSKTKDGKSIKLFTQIKSTLNQMISYASKGDTHQFNTTSSDLRKMLFIGKNAKYDIEHIIDVIPDGPTLNIIRIKDRATGIIKDVTVSDNVTKDVNPNSLSEVVNALKEMNVTFNIDSGSINTQWAVDKSENYNNILFESDILYSNLAKAEVEGGYFYINMIDKDMNEVKTEAPSPKKSNERTILNVSESVVDNDGLIDPDLVFDKDAYTPEEKAKIDTVIEDDGFIDPDLVEDSPSTAEAQQQTKIKDSTPEKNIIPKENIIPKINQEEPKAKEDAVNVNKVSEKLSEPQSTAPAVSSAPKTKRQGKGMKHFDLAALQKADNNTNQTVRQPSQSDIDAVKKDIDETKKQQEKYCK